MEFLNTHCVETTCPTMECTIAWETVKSTSEILWKLYKSDCMQLSDLDLESETTGDLDTDDEVGRD